MEVDQEVKPEVGLEVKPEVGRQVKLRCGPGVGILLQNQELDRCNHLTTKQ